MPSPPFREREDVTHRLAIVLRHKTAIVIDQMHKNRAVALRLLQ